jgi:hypothetical protein
MNIKILGTESLGVGGLCCKVTVQDSTIVIDPGVALGYNRHGFLPHPVQVTRGEDVRRTIIAALKDATDVVISHYHGDHVPLPDANPYQLKADTVAPLLKNVRIWAQGRDSISHNMQSRSLEISTVLKKPLPNAEGKCEGIFTFSQSVPHGDPHTRFGTVMMTRIKEDYVFVHASDIQMLYTPTIKKLIQWEPDVVIASGPPVYIPYLSAEQKEIAQYNAEMLAEAVDTLILDHHVLRSIKGMAWVDALPSNVVCAADFMGLNGDFWKRAGGIYIRKCLFLISGMSCMLMVKFLQKNTRKNINE